MNEENILWAAKRMQDAADKAQAAADRMESAAHRIALLLEDGYGGNGLRLIEALETASVKPEEAPEKKAPKFLIRWDSPLHLAGAIRRAFARLVRGKTLLTTKGEASRRLSICKQCPRYSGGQCTVCTCLVEAKVWSAAEACPKGFWTITKKT